MRDIRLRFSILCVVVITSFLVLGVRLWQLQIVSGDEYSVSADRNRYRLVSIDAPRGVIYDREGRLLVRNVPSFNVYIIPGNLPEEEKERNRVLSRVGELLDLPATEDVSGAEETSLEGILEQRTIGAYQPVRVAKDVDRQAALVLEEEQFDLSGVYVEAQPLRQYLQGSLLSHVIGHMGSIPENRTEAYVEQGYDPNDRVGVTGLELTQEELLRGVKGEKHIEVDAFEREVALIAIDPPQEGRNMHLTIDLDLQEVVEESLRKGMRKVDVEVGVAIVMDPRSGEILAMSSLPSYDNNLYWEVSRRRTWSD